MIIDYLRPDSESMSKLEKETRNAKYLLKDNGTLLNVEKTPILFATYTNINQFCSPDCDSPLEIILNTLCIPLPSFLER